MRAWHSLKYKLPLLISTLLCVIVLAICGLAYHRIEDLLLRSAGTRLAHSTHRLADLLEEAARRTHYDVRRLAVEPAITAFVLRPTATTRQAAQQLLERQEAGASRPVAFAIWRREGERLLAVGALPAAVADAWRSASPAAVAPGGMTVGPLVGADGGVLYTVGTPIYGARRDTVGYLVTYRRLASGASAEQIGGLIGPDATLLVGNATGRLWTDLARTMAGPPARFPVGVPTEYAATDGTRLLAVTMPIRSTPWLVLVQMPRRAVLAPAIDFVLTIAPLALLLITLGTLAVCVVSDQVTTPLAEISQAARDLARGNYARRVTITRRDELGSLAQSFNSMATQVEAAARDLQGHAGDLEAANTELRESEQRYRQLVEISPDAVFVHRDGRIHLVNPAAVSLVGAASPADVIGRFVLDLLPEEDPATLGEELRRTQEDRQRVQVSERRLLRLDGALRTVEGARTPFSLDGMPAALTILRDISERKQLEDRSRQSQKMEAVGQLAGGIAHDFNNLLTVIASCSGMLLAELPEDDRLRDDAREIVNAADRAAALTRQLLAFSRQQVLQPRVLDPNQVISDMERMLRRVLPADIRLVTGLDPALGRVWADPGQLEQVVMNLVVNARDAMPDGGMLVIEAADVDLTEDDATLHPPAATGPYVTITVTDSGMGMPEDVRARIFEPFYTTKEAGQGTGLGLATVYGIVTQSGGHVWVCSEPGCGTTFKVYLPRVDAPADRRSTAEVSPVGGGMATILLAEDETPVRTVARRILESAGYTVLEAASGSEALQLLHQSGVRIDLLLTDITMPDMKGLELAAQFRELQPEARTVFMSGDSEDATLRQNVGERGFTFIQKPFTSQSLTRTLREVLDGSASGVAG